MAAETVLAISEERGRARIVREARGLFMAQGFAAVSMQQIADAAGVNKATLYHHFRDKEDLFVSVMAVEFTNLIAGLQAAIAAGGTLREQLTRIAAYLFAQRHSDFGRLSGDLHEHVSERGRAYLIEHCGAPWEQIRGAIGQAMRAGEVREVDPDLVARLFFAMVGSQAWWTKFGSERREPDAALAATLADLLLDGIGAGPGASPDRSEQSAPLLAGDGSPAIPPPTT